MGNKSRALVRAHSEHGHVKISHFFYIGLLSIGAQLAENCSDSNISETARNCRLHGPTPGSRISRATTNFNGKVGLREGQGPGVCPQPRGEGREWIMGQMSNRGDAPTPKVETVAPLEKSKLAAADGLCVPPAAFFGSKN